MLKFVFLIIFFQYVAHEWAKGVFSDAENLTEERVDEVLSQYLNDYKEGSPETKGWPANVAAYILSKAAMNAYTRILAKKYPNFCINCVCPGYVKTEMTYNAGRLTVEEGAESPVWLALLHKGGPSGLFFSRKEETLFLLQMIHRSLHIDVEFTYLLMLNLNK